MSDTATEPTGFMMGDRFAPQDLFREIKPASLTQMTSFQKLPQLSDDSGVKTKQGAENNLFGMIGLGLVVWFGFSNLRHRRRT